MSPLKSIATTEKASDIEPINRRNKTMAWKAIEIKRSGGGNPEPTITVTKSGTLRINRAAQTAYGVDDYGFVRFHEDDEAPRIGLELLKEAGKGINSIKGEKKGEGSGRVISAAALINAYNLKLGAYPLTRDEETGI